MCMTFQSKKKVCLTSQPIPTRSDSEYLGTVTLNFWLCIMKIIFAKGTIVGIHKWANAEGKLQAGTPAFSTFC